uniref:GCVT N-terminal domain-containing protein n=1 Tax=Timema cristinae TaxID=61476 RepID=A0A7R9CZ26_TIMCR|nr:unnamed protein product [Timema cristinae]
MTYPLDHSRPVSESTNRKSPGDRRDAEEEKIVVARACDEMEENRISNKTLTEQGEEYKTYWKTKDEMDGPNAERHGGKKEDWRNTAKLALHVYTQLIEAGKKYGIRHAGYYAMRAIRVERFYAFWGQDLDTTTTPLECGRSWRVKFDKGKHFIGQEALEKQRSEGVKRMYVQLVLNDHDPEFDVVAMWQ